MSDAYILDTGAFLSGFTFFENESYTVNEVVDEIKSDPVRFKLELSLKEGKLVVLDPPDSKLVHKISNYTGDRHKLSYADLKILYLAVFLKKKGYSPIILSNDYRIQNVALKLKIKFFSTSEKKIQKFIRWHKICIGCNKEFKESYDGICDNCGSNLKTRAIK
tara:strand:+ start:452 stop:940 length:489 start_codon:yes stop_codon:yes gene_type:complete